jgi:flagellar hook-associated protein 2
MSSLALSGLASGVDTSAIVDQLMAIERQKVTRINNTQTTVTAHQAALKGLSDKLNAFQTAAAALNDPTTWKTTQSSTTSDASKVTVAQLDGAGIGGHTISVDRLASSAQHGFAYVPNAAAGSFTITSGATTATISVGANATAKEVATAINSSTSAPVYAAVVKDDDGTDRIVMSSRKTGASADFSVNPTGLPGGLSEDTDYSRTGTVLNAAFHVDGDPTARTSQTNSIENAIPGLRITLSGVTTTPVTVSTNDPALDKASISTKAKAFVDAYNAVVDLGRADIAEKRPTSRSTTSDYQTGTLFGDLGLDSMLSSMKNVMTQTVSNIGGLTSLADVGIGLPKSTGVVNDDAKAGKLTFDPAKLSSAIDTNPTQVQQLFNGVGARKGFSLMVNDFVRAQTGLSGVLTGRMNNDSSSLTDLASQVTATNERLTQTQSRLQAQFAAMETALANSQSQQAWLTGQIASLPHN